MASPWTKADRNEYGLVYAKARYANYAITMFTTGIQFFMMAYSLAIYFETPREKRKGRAPYLVIGCLIFILSTLSACTDIAIIFNSLLEASDGLSYLAVEPTGTWQNIFSETTFFFVFILGDGLLLYRCYLMLFGGWLWLVALPILTYLATIALSIFQIVTFAQEEGDGIRIAISMECARNILSVATNIIITFIICHRLMSSHKRWAESLPTKRLVVYSAAMRILVESALPLSVAGIVQAGLQIVPVTLGGRISDYTGNRNALIVAMSTSSLIYYALLAIAPQMVILRVTTGRSWAKTERSTDVEIFSRSLAFNHGARGNESELSRDNDDETNEEIDKSEKSV
ncbi:hypothetical protein FA15DRAFT_644395 [Coprinopsis marcescibilis]|uniref:Fungal pheromone STE3G-protein-coupled receptor n=1 Tax=Coprinopsis marcescibilis TaxID=230819 RepID=A0A5C3KR65_COPMA|nr:hypothetical protein FA15DRAFT_644395 [Coprinopsis marcescibilis]